MLDFTDANPHATRFMVNGTGSAPADASNDSAFVRFAQRLITVGYSPLPIAPGQKRPDLTGWQQAAGEQMSGELLGNFIHQNRHGLGVACGFGGLVAIDIDTEDPDIMAAVRTALPESTVAKRGKKGRTDFYRAAVEIKNAKIKESGSKSPIVEILSTGNQTVIPPTIHPETGLPYEWLTLIPLWEISPLGLPMITPDHVEQLRRALLPWTEKPKAAPVTAVSKIEPHRGSASEHRLKPYAIATIEGRCGDLAKQSEPGRNNALFDAARYLGNFAHHSVVSKGDLTICLLNACKANGLYADDGEHACQATIDSGIEKAENDPLLEPKGESVSASRQGKKAEKEEQKVQRLLSRPPWLRDAIKGSDGLTILGCVANVNMVLRGDPAFEGRITFDAFSKRVFRWNVPWDLEHEAKEWSDIDDTRLAEYCQLQEVPAGTGVCAQAVASVAHEYPSHPPRDYLNGLDWDGVERLKDGPQVYFGAKPNVFASECFSRWMISAVARIVKPGCKADYTLVLEGLQRSGKSSSLEKLLPEKEWFSDDISGRIGDKDTALSLQGKMIVELGELSAFKGASASEIKAWLSRQVDRVRAPYGRRAMDVQRSNVFAATTNEAEYLKDPTGGSRFWPIKCGAFNLEAIERDRDQLWAEAVHLYKAGAKWWLPPEMEALARVEQESRRATDPWQALVLEWVETRTHGDITVERILSEECLDIRKDMQSPKAKSRVVDILTNNGWRQTRPRDDEGKRRRIYVKIDETEDDGAGTQG